MIGKVRKKVELSLTKFPPCQACNAPYKPTKPIVDYGVVFFDSPDLIARMLFAIENLFRNLRVKRMRKL